MTRTPNDDIDTIFVTIELKVSSFDVMPTNILHLQDGSAVVILVIHVKSGSVHGPARMNYLLAINIKDSVAH